MKITKNNAIKASTIIQRLPFHRQFTKSQSMLTKVLPVWSQWSDKNVDDRLSKCCSPIHFHEGILTIECTNAVAATQLQQRQKSLLRYFHKQSLIEIKQITVRLANKSINKLDKRYVFSSSDGKQAEGSTKDFVSLDTKALDSIKSCQKQVGHQPLSESLGRLIDSLKPDKK